MTSKLYLCQSTHMNSKPTATGYCIQVMDLETNFRSSEIVLIQVKVLITSIFKK